MAYTPTTWVTGDTITAVKLNNMEQGIASAGGLIVLIEPTQDGMQLIFSKTWKEIYDAITAVPVIFLRVEANGNYNDISILLLNNISEYDGQYFVMVAETEYSTNSENGYPQTHFED